MSATSEPRTFEIIGHATFRRATSANRVALYIGAAVMSNGRPFSRDDLALDVAALEVGDYAKFARIPFAGVDTSRPVIVQRVA